MIAALPGPVRAGEGTCATGPEVQWTPGAGGNGHFYQAVCPDALLTWDQATAAAVASGRHLATLTSDQENAFAFALVDDQDFWFLNTFNCNIGPWLGGFQPPGSDEPGGGWSWVTGEAFSYNAWWPGEPNDFGDGENRIHFFNCAGGQVRTAHWNDSAGTVPIAGYVTEWSHSLDVDGDGEVEPLTDGLLILRRLFGFGGAALLTGAVDTVNCTRCDATSIEAFIGLLVLGRVHDVTQDWSDGSNPNGVWSYLEGTDPLPHVDSWASTVGGYSAPQPGWAASENGTDRLPFFYKSLGAEEFTLDVVAGDVVCHSRDDSNGVGQGDARLRFTAPATGLYRVALDVWIGRDIGRTVNWSLSADAVEQDTGTVASGDVFSRASPDGYRGSHALEAGDAVDLLLTTPAAAAGDFVGLRLRLEAFGLDVDGDGEVLPLTDGLLILRWLFGFTGTALVSSVVDLANCTRCDASAIEAYLAAFD